MRISSGYDRFGLWFSDEFGVQDCCISFLIFSGYKWAYATSSLAPKKPFGVQNSVLSRISLAQAKALED